jgi:hypothetical protein
MTGVRFRRGNSHDIASIMMGQGWEGRPTERWQDKSREVRGGRSGEEGMRIKRLARCATLCDSLSGRISSWQCTHDHTSRPSTQ